MSTITVNDLSFSYTDILIFDHADIRIDDHWKLGLVGRNGRGKTTLLKLLLGQLDTDAKVQTDKTFVYFPQDVPDKSQLVFYVLSELTDAEQWKIERELRYLSVDPEVLWRSFETLSGGEQTKVLLAILFLDEGNFPLIDEPTNHLDAASRQQVANYLKRKTGYILVSHDRDFLDQTADHIMAIEKSKIVLYQGNFSTYEAEKEGRDAFELAQDTKLRKEIGRLKQTARDKHDWSMGREKDKYGKPSVKGSGGIGDTGFIGARAARVMKKSKVLEARMDKEIAEKESLLKDIEHIEGLTMPYAPTHRKILVDIENLSVGYDNHLLFPPISIKIEKGQRVAILGRNGSGKSSLLRAVIDALDSNVTISLVRQIYDDNRGELKTFAEKSGIDYQVFLRNLKKLGMERHVFKQKIEDMSQGQQKKVELARSLSQEAELYIWDEPLNYLDVFNHKQIEAVIKAVQPTMLVVDHDRHFISEIATDIIDLDKVE
jgi:lincosamide and streptogramin A transport system ATP-binding/permease protein